MTTLLANSTLRPRSFALAAVGLVCSVASVVDASVRWPRVVPKDRPTFSTTPAVSCEGNDGAVCEAARRLAPKVRTWCRGKERSLLVVASVDERAQSADELARSVAGSLAGLLQDCRVAAASHSSSKSKAMRLVTPKRRVLFVRAAIRHGKLTLKATGVERSRNFWDWARSSAAVAAKTWEQSSPLDATVLRFFSIPRIAGNVESRVSVPLRHVLAIRCSLDAKGENLVATVLSRRRLTQWELGTSGHAPVLRRRFEIHETLPIAPTPWREPFGSIAFENNGSIDVTSSDRAWGISLDGAWHVLRRLHGFAFPWGKSTACFSSSTGWLVDKAATCSDSAVIPLMVGFPKRFDALDTTWLLDSFGHGRLVVAVRQPAPHRRLRLLDPATTSATIEPVGAQVAVADIDMDGSAEVVYSAPVKAPWYDYVTLQSWVDGRVLKLKYRKTVPGVTAMAVCPPDGLRPRALLVAGQREIVVLR